MRNIARRFWSTCIVVACQCMLPPPASAFGDVIDWSRATDAWRNESPAQRTRTKCQEANGLWLEEVSVSACEDQVVTVRWGDEVHQQRCEDGTGTILTNQCAHFDLDGQAYFDDGPSIPHTLQIASTALGDHYDLLLWNDLFWTAGVNHDFCYGYNPVTYGYSRDDCDTQFLEDLAAVCEHRPHYAIDWFSEHTCKWYAALMYSAVSLSGETAWSAQNSEVYYGDWQPLWKQYGLPAQPSTDEVRFYTTVPASSVSWPSFAEWLNQGEK